MTRRIGVLGGTFDPIHFGHVQLAEMSLKKCCLSEILFIPAADPPHKQSHEVVDFIHRVNMIKIALAGREYFHLSELEAGLPSPSYTIDTLSFLKKNRQNDEDFFFILGEDAFLEIDSWKSYEELLSLTHFIVCGRSGYSTEYFKSLAQSLGYSFKGETWFHPLREHEIIYLPTATDDISSTKVRERLRKNMSLRGLVCPEVVRYIRNHQLYR